MSSASIGAVRKPEDLTASGIAREIVRLIEQRVYSPGSRIIEQDLADRFQVSRGPVREAIRMLAAQGVLKLTHQRGASVIRMSDEEAVDAIEISALLFGLAARRAALSTDPLAKEKINRFARRLETLAKGTIGSSEFFQETLAAGRTLLDVADSKRVSEEIMRIRAGAPNLLGPLCFPTKSIRRKAARTWMQLADAIAEGDEKKAERLALRTHSDALSAALEIAS